jgi:excisionase family DNA binding protein
VDEVISPEVLRIARILAASGIPAETTTPARTRPYRVPEAAKILDIHPVTLYREVSSGNCRAERSGKGRGTIRIPVDALAEYKVRIQRRAATLAEAVA